MVRQHDHDTAGHFQYGFLIWPWLIHQATCRLHTAATVRPCRNCWTGICHRIPGSTCALRYRHPAQGRLAQRVLPNRHLTRDAVETGLALKTISDRAPNETYSDFSQVSVNKAYWTQDLRHRTRHHRRTWRKRLSCTPMASAPGRREHIWHYPAFSLEHSLLMEGVKVLPVRLSTVGQLCRIKRASFSGK